MAAQVGRQANDLDVVAALGEGPERPLQATNGIEAGVYPPLAPGASGYLRDGAAQGAVPVAPVPGAARRVVRPFADEHVSLLGSPRQPTISAPR